MWRLTIKHGNYEDLLTMTNDSQHPHEWNYEGDGFWRFWSVAEGNTMDWEAMVSDVRWVTDVQLAESAEGESEGEGESEAAGPDRSDDDVTQVIEAVRPLRRDMDETQVITTVTEPVNRWGGGMGGGTGGGMGDRPGWGRREGDDRMGRAGR